MSNLNALRNTRKLAELGEFLITSREAKPRLNTILEEAGYPSESVNAILNVEMKSTYRLVVTHSYICTEDGNKKTTKLYIEIEKDGTYSVDF